MSADAGKTTDPDERLYGRAGASTRPLWLDHWQYARQLLLRGEPTPWFRATEFDAFFRKVDGLLDGDVVVFPLLPIMDAHVPTGSELAKEMGSKQRTAFAAKALLRDETLRSSVSSCIGLMADAAPPKPIVVSVPSPRELLAWAYGRAHGAPPAEVTVDLADNGAMYLSDFFSALGDCAISGVMVEESPAELAEYQSAYSSLRNVCSYQRWGLGFRVAGSLERVEPFDFSVVTSPPGASAGALLWGAWLPHDFWATDAHFEQPTAAFLYGQIPADANPERVLQRREKLRVK